MYGEAPKELYLSKEQKVKKMSEIDPNEETTEKISALEKVTKAELNKCNTIKDKMEWLGKVLGQAIFENDMNYAVWVNVQKNNIIEQLKKENEQLKAYESHWKEIEEDAKVIAKENAELKKEIEKLKEKLKDTEKSRDYWKSSSFDWRHKCTSRKPFKVAVKAQKQLAKAKEFIEELSSSLSVVGECEEEECKLLNRAEQFLSEVEK